MTIPYRISARRIALAIAFSIMVHSLLLWQLPALTPLNNEASLPQLQAKLETLPKLAKKSLARKYKTKAQAPIPPIVKPVIETLSAINDETALPLTDDPLASNTSEPYPPAPDVAGNDEKLAAPLLPKYAQLHFTVQHGEGSIKVGEVRHTLESIDGRFTLSAVTQTTGVASVFKNYNLRQTSTGTFTKQGLRPENYEEIRTDSKGTKTFSSRFDWNAMKTHFSDGREVTLIEQTQDMLSLPYQLSQLPLNMEILTIALSNGKKISNYFLTVGSDETISTAMGELRTVKLHRVQGENEEGLIIWLALEYRLLPVKILYLDKTGEISANMLITDIRVSDN